MGWLTIVCLLVILFGFGLWVGYYGTFKPLRQVIDQYEVALKEYRGVLRDYKPAADIEVESEE